jgi:carbon storage regulator CsrA
MLALSRLPGESIVMETRDGPIRVKYVRDTQYGIRLAIEAPRSVRILREEISHHHQGRAKDGRNSREM